MRLVASHRGRTKGVLVEPSSMLPHALSGLLAVEERTQNELRTGNKERRIKKQFTPIWTTPGRHCFLVHPGQMVDGHRTDRIEIQIQ